MDQTQENDAFALTATVQDYVPTDDTTSTDAAPVDPTDTGSPDEPVAAVDDGLVDVTENVLQTAPDASQDDQPTDQPIDQPPADTVFQIGDGAFLHDNGLGMDVAEAAYQEAVSEGADFSAPGDYYYQGGMISYIPSESSPAPSPTPADYPADPRSDDAGHS